VAQWISSLDKDVTIALIGLIGAVVGGLVVGVLNIVSAHLGNLAHSYADATQTQQQQEEDKSENAQF
jgi:hypothetical protein